MDRELRILHVNKFTRLVGGVEANMRQLAATQIERGHDVNFFSAADVATDGFDVDAHTLRGRLASISTLLWSRSSEVTLAKVLADERPDIVHFHNIYHHLSASVVAAARRSGSATVMTLHDYKLAAPCYLLFRDGHECHECLGRRIPLPAIRHRCVKGSIAASSVCATEQVLHRPVYRRGIDAFIAPSVSAKRLFAQSNGPPEGAVHVVPHGVRFPSIPVDLEHARKRVVFMGRLSPEKGIQTLLAAWRAADLPDPWDLLVVGDGAEREQLEASAPARVHFAGYREGAELTALLRDASISAVPSNCPETFGLSAAEAMAEGLPVVVSSVGNLPFLVGDHRVVAPPGDVDSWATILRWLAGSTRARKDIGTAARQRIESHFDVQVAADRTDAVYGRALLRRGVTTGHGRRVLDA